MATDKRPGANLLALTASALCLPAYSGSAQAWADPESETGYRFTYYHESALPGSVTNGRDGSRYEVLSNQFHLLRPWSEGYDYSADLTVETMSGASPWFIVPGAGGKPIQIMSGATIDDQRYALDLKGRRYREQGRDGVRVGVSKEKDYLSLNTGAETEQELDGGRTASAGIGYSHDELSPTDGGSALYPTRVTGADKNSFNAYAGLSQIFDPDTIAQVALSFDYDSGFLSDPYKEVYVDADLLQDARPGRRTQGAFSARLRHYFNSLRAALHFDYRYFADSWGVQADTAEVSWQQEIGRQWRLAPALRWYDQSAADFYQPYFTTTRSDGHYTSDYRLSGFGALSLRLSLVRDTPTWSASLSAERYDSERAYSLRGGSGGESPSLVDFTVISASFGYRFF